MSRMEAMEQGESMEQWLAAVVRGYSFLHRYPYHAGVLSRLLPVVDYGVYAMAVSRSGIGDRIRLHVNPDFFEENPDITEY